MPNSAVIICFCIFRNLIKSSTITLNTLYDYENHNNSRARWRPLHFRAPWPRQAHTAAARTPCWGWKPPQKGRPMAVGSTSQAVTATTQHSANSHLGKNQVVQLKKKMLSLLWALVFMQPQVKAVLKLHLRRACHNYVSTTSELRHCTHSPQHSAAFSLPTLHSHHPVLLLPYSAWEDEMASGGGKLWLPLTQKPFCSVSKPTP